jgi:two-component system chemotaxis response regulator CheB
LLAPFLLVWLRRVRESVLTDLDRHDIVVIGASAGGVEALTRVMRGMPAEFRAAIFVVLHMPAESPSVLAHILDRSGPLRATQVLERQPIQTGRIYVAPPNRHLVVHRGAMTLEAGPRENNARPSVDRLFRSASWSYGRRVVGVVLSGAMRDGALGVAAIKLRGGIAIVQDPGEALFAGMPESALNATEIDFCLPVADIPERLTKLTNNPANHQSMPTDDESEQQPCHCVSLHKLLAKRPSVSVATPSVPR